MVLSIIIVTYNSEKDIKSCLDSIISKTEGILYEVWIIDNDSSDLTCDIVSNYCESYSNINMIKTKNNGFNAGNNIGIKNSTGKYIALLNPDTILLNNAFKIIIEGMEKVDNVGACGGTLYNSDMTLNMSHGSYPTFFETLIRLLKIRDDNKYYIADLSKKTMKVCFPSGADFVFKREIIDKIGLMDEEYFIYFDETDYACKMKKIGLKSYLFTDAKIIHLQGQSTSTTSEFSQKMFLKSYILYLKKNLSKLESISITLLKLFNHYCRLSITSLLGKKYREKSERHTQEIDFHKYVLKNIL